MAFRAGALPAAFLGAACCEAFFPVADAAAHGLTVAVFGVALAARPFSFAFQIGKGVVGSPSEPAGMAMAACAFSFAAANSFHLAAELPDRLGDETAPYPACLPVLEVDQLCCIFLRHGVQAWDLKKLFVSTVGGSSRATVSVVVGGGRKAETGPGHPELPGSV